MIMVGQKCECQCHTTINKHIKPCCFQCPCCGERIAYGDEANIKEKRKKFIRDHLICCTSYRPEPIRYGEPSALDRYFKQFGIEG